MSDELPSTFNEKIGAALPIALTAIATAFAGMSTSEMTRAMYWRSAAAQDQAKANDQWTLAGFKRDRSLIVQTTAVQLRAMAGYRAGPEISRTPTPDVVRKAGRWLGGGDEPPVEDANIAAVLIAVRDRRSEEEGVRLARELPFNAIEQAIAAAERSAYEVDTAWDAEVSEADRRAREATTAAQSTGDAKAIAASNLAQAARFEADYHRYRAQATMNQWVGCFYEMRVRKAVGESVRHRTRSENFFYAMLAAQVGATLASLGMARKQKSALWLVAGVSGLVAVGFGTWVYLTM
jgi:hypothetical protein